MVRRAWFPILTFVMLAAVVPAGQTASSGLSLVLAQRVDMERVTAMARDADGYIWAVGFGSDSTLPTSPDALMPTARGGTDGFLERIAPDGSLDHLTYIGGRGDDRLHGVSIDAAGYIYIMGVTTSPDLPTTSGAFDRLCGPDGSCRPEPSAGPRSDAFVMKLAPGGRSIIYSTYLGGAGEDVPRALALDGLDRAVVVGLTLSADFPVTPDALPAPPDMGGGFYLRLTSDGGRLDYSTVISGSRGAEAMGVAVDATDAAYVVGSTESAVFPTKSALQSELAGANDAFLMRFTDTGELTYSTFIGGSDNDEAYGVAVSSNAVYVVGFTCSRDFPGAPRFRQTADCDAAGFLTKVQLDGSQILQTRLFEGSYRDDRARAVAVDASDRVFVTGAAMSIDMPATADAAQITHGGGAYDAFFAAVPMGESATAPMYLTYHGGDRVDHGWAVLADGAGGAWIGGTSFSLAYPSVNPKRNTGDPAFIAHYAQTGAPAPESDDIVLYAKDATAVSGDWQPVEDATAAGGQRMWNPDAGVPKITTPAAAPASYFELTFEAEANVPYHLWLRMKADNDHWTNDSVYVQFSGTIDSLGNPVWRIGTTSAAMVSLEDCGGCGESGWGWNDNGYDTAGLNVRFAESGTHTIRIQQREDGISIDQVVLSTRTYMTTPPGAARDDATILPASDGGPPPPPPSDPKEIVLYPASDRLAAGQNWQSIADATAAGGARLFNPDQGAPKLSSPSAAGNDYFEVQFTAEAGVPYHLWIRSQALDDHWMNDSVFVQFSGSVDVSGSPTFRIGSAQATIVSLEDCGGCGEQGWGWNDNGYGFLADPIYFATSGPQTIRVLRREDGISIDQIVLSAGTYLNAAPGAAKNDTTIVPK